MTCFPLLNVVPNFMKRSHLYFLDVRILTIKDNWVTFLYFMENDREMTFDWLNTFTKTNIPRAHY